jgi:FLVCR family MFS transporter 7
MPQRFVSHSTVSKIRKYILILPFLHQFFAGLCGALMIAGGAFGAIISGIYVDRSKKFAEVIKFSYAGAVLAGLAFTQV